MRTRGTKLVVALVAMMAATMLPASAADPSVQIHANRSVYVAGQSATLSFTISNAGQQTHLKVVLTYANGARQTLNDTDVNTDSVPDETAYMYFDARVDAYIGGATEPSATLALPVRAKVAITISGYYHRSGSWAVFPAGTQPTFVSGTTPSHYGRCLKHEVWKHYSSGWRVILLSACKWENGQGVVSWKWTGNHSAGGYYRVRAKFPGDHLNHPNSSAFIYFKFA